MMSREAALAQNPENPAPPETMESLEVVDIRHLGFDGRWHEGQLVVHRDAVPDVREFFALAGKLEFPIAHAIPISAPQYHWDDEVSCADNNSSAFNYRFIAGTERLSRHADGLAFDVNPLQNPYIRFDREENEISRTPRGSAYDEQAPGTLTKDHPLVVLMRERGWTWGGDWDPKEGVVDYQHFERQ